MRELVSLRVIVPCACLSEGSLFNIQQNGDENKERQQISHDSEK